MTNSRVAPSSAFTAMLVTGMLLAGAGAALVTVVPTWLGLALPVVGLGLIAAAVARERNRRSSA